MDLRGSPLGGFEFFEVKAWLACRLNDHLFAGNDLICGGADSGGDIVRDNDGTMLVGMYQVAVLNAHATNGDRAAKINDMDIGV